MLPQQLFEKLEQLGFIEDRALKKIRREIDDPEKNPSVKGILNYLVKKGHLTTSQAIQLKKELDKPKPVQHEELEVSVVADQGYDTDELTANVVEEVVKKPARKSDPQVTAIDASPPAKPVPQKSEKKAKAAEAFVEELPAVDPYHEPIDDPLDDPALRSGMDSGTYHTAAQGQVHSFAGKIDKSDQWSTKWLYIAFGSLGLLLIVGAVLYLAVHLVSAEDRFKAAMKSYETGAYPDAIAKFDEFLKKHPSHEKVPIVKVRRVQAMIASPFEQKNWEETIKIAKSKLPELIDNENIDSSLMDSFRDDLAVMLPTATFEIAKQAIKQDGLDALKAALAKAKDAKEVIDNSAYIPPSKLKKPSVAKLFEGVNETIARGDSLIQKQVDYNQALAEIQGLRVAKKTDEAFRRYNLLIRQYGDLAAEEALQNEMRAVSDQERELVATTPASFKIDNQSRPSPIVSSIVLASRNGTPLPNLTGEVIPVLADGSVYGVDVGDGSVKWRKFVGNATDIEPELFDAQTILVANQADNDLFRIKRINGEIIWHAEIGEPFLTPTFDENQIVLTTRSGKIIKLDPATGQSTAAIQLPKSANVNSMISDRNPYIYQPGLYSNLYVLSSDDLSCQDVFYLGHANESIAIPPVSWSGYILIAVNQSDSCDLYVLKPTENGLNLQPVQRLRRITSGIVTNPMIRFGRWILITSETGDMKILELNTADEQNPVRKLAEEKFENREGNRNYLLTEGSQLWIANKGLTRYRMQRALGQFSRELISNHSDYFIGPLRKYGDALVHIRRRNGSAHVSVSAVDAQTLTQIWRTDLSGPPASTPIPLEDNVLAISSQGDLFTIDDAAEAAGTTEAPVKSSNIAENLLFDETLGLPDGNYVCLGPPGRPDILFVDAKNNQSKLLRLQSPADKFACRPVLIGDNLLVASASGQVARVDPKTGRIVGTPFLPPVKSNETVAWKPAAVLSPEKFVIGGDQVFYLIDASNPRSLKKMAEVEAAGVIKSPAVSIGQTVFSVTGGNDGDSIVAYTVGSDLTQAGKTDMSARYANGPWVVAGNILVHMDNDQLVCLDPQLAEKWSVPLGSDLLAAAPQDNNGQIVLTFRSGKMTTIDSTNGQVTSNFDLGQPIIHLPLFVGDKVYFAGINGTVYVTKRQN